MLGSSLKRLVMMVVVEVVVLSSSIAVRQVSVSLACISQFFVSIPISFVVRNVIQVVVSTL